MPYKVYILKNEKVMKFELWKYLKIHESSENAQKVT